MFTHRPCDAHTELGELLCSCGGLASGSEAQRWGPQSVEAKAKAQSSNIHGKHKCARMAKRLAADQMLTVVSRVETALQSGNAHRINIYTQLAR